jgi:hypothetical protein
MTYQPATGQDEAALRARIAAALADPGNLTPAEMDEYEQNWSAR